jgi:hypothetical protein
LIAGFSNSGCSASNSFHLSRKSGVSKPFTSGYETNNKMGYNTTRIESPYYNQVGYPVPFLDAAAMQWIASTALTLAGVAIASVAATFGYRQNYGWKPVVLVTSHGFGGIGRNTESFDATCQFEFWNRRKYPVVIRFVVVRLGNLRILMH